jgi:type II pantothenate kinase
MNFETDRIDDCIEFMKHLQDKQLVLNGSRSGDLCVMATGGGAYKFYDKIRERLGVDVVREDEMECLIAGTVFLPTLVLWSNYVTAANLVRIQASTSS